MWTHKKKGIIAEVCAEGKLDIGKIFDEGVDFGMKCEKRKTKVIEEVCAEQKLATLILQLMELGRRKDMEEACSSRDAREILYREFGIA